MRLNGTDINSLCILWLCFQQCPTTFTYFDMVNYLLNRNNQIYFSVGSLIVTVTEGTQSIDRVCPEKE